MLKMDYYGQNDHRSESIYPSNDRLQYASRSHNIDLHCEFDSFPADILRGFLKNEKHLMGLAFTSEISVLVLWLKTSSKSFQIIWLFFLIKAQKAYLTKVADLAVRRRATYLRRRSVNCTYPEWARLVSTQILRQNTIDRLQQWLATAFRLALMPTNVLLHSTISEYR